MSPMRFFPDLDEWMQRRARGYYDSRGEWIIYGGQMHIHPPMPVGVVSSGTGLYAIVKCVSSLKP